MQPQGIKREHDRWTIYVVSDFIYYYILYFILIHFLVIFITIMHDYICLDLFIYF